MKIEDFGEQLLVTGDLDPIYLMLYHTDMDRDQLRRWCLAYWCSYHAGVSSWLSEFEGAGFWNHIEQFARNTDLSPVNGRWPRGTERRHFRGDKALTSVYWLADHFSSPEAPVSALENLAKPIHFKHVRNAVTVWPQFGPWIAFKIGDMLDRVLGVPVDFTDSDVFMFDSPREAAELWAGETGPNAIKRALAHLEVHLGDRYMAPPLNDRRVGLQEFETILCKYKSHVNGHYPIGKDIREIHHALTEWKEASSTAAILLETLDAHTGVHGS